MAALNISIEVVLELSLLDLAVRLVDLDDLVKRPRSVVHAADHAADIIHPDLVEIEIFDLLAKMLDALRIPRDVDVTVEVVSVVMVHIHEERHRRVIQHNVARLAIRTRIHDDLLVSPFLDDPVLDEPLENLRLVMVALDDVESSVQPRKDARPFLVVVAPDHVPRE